jgi:Rrf2 family protein
VKSDYALSAATVIARGWPDARVRGADIAAAEELPLKYLHAILVALKTAGIVSTRRGHDGGYQLTRPPEEITVAAILQAVDCPLVAEPDALTSGTTGPMWAAAEGALGRVLLDWTLADLAIRPKRRGQAQPTRAKRERKASSTSTH